MIGGMRLVNQALGGPGDLSDRSILRFHRRVEYAPLVTGLLLAIVAAVVDFGGTFNNALMPTLAQVLPVLFLAQLVDSAFFAQRLSKEMDADDADQELARRYLSITALASLTAFLLGEGAALYAVAFGASAFTVTLVIAVGVLQALDLALGPQLRGSFRPTALKRMIDARNRERSSASTADPR
jgi:FtsH-binding integral membrane protein